MERMLNRRGFLSAALVTVASVMTFGRVAWAKGKLKFVSPKDTTAKMLKYSPDAAKSERKDKSQNCKTCIHYTKTGMIDGKEAGKCNLITSGQVAAAGWCASWVKKPG